MAWYKTGSVSVTSGQTTVTGTGTNFASNVRVGDGFKGPNGLWYEIVNVASQTVLGIFPAYAGPTVTANTNYMIAPLQGYNKESADRLRAITDSLPTALEEKQDKNQNLTAFSGLVGAADRLPYFTGTGALSITTLTTIARSLLSSSDSTTMRNVMSSAKSGSNSDITALSGITTALSVSQGGTGSLTASGARSQLGVDVTLASSILDPSAGGLMFYSSNANGEFWKFANGMLINKAKLTSASIASNTTSVVSGTYPHQFLPGSQPCPLGMVRAGTSIDHYGIIGGSQSDGGSHSSVVFFVRNGGTAQTFQIWYISIGVWK